MSNMTPRSDDADLVSVFKTDEPGLLPLARLTLEQAGIDFTVETRDVIVAYPLPLVEGELSGPFEILVRAEDEGRARDLLIDLERATPAASAPVAPPPVRRTVEARDDGAAGEVELFSLDTGASLGVLTGAQFESIASHLEQESTEDDDYYIDAATLTMLEDEKADATAIDLLRRALGSKPGLDVRWDRR